jgi:hypothetical protein
MKTIYLQTTEQLKTIASLRWIDADMGQLEFYGDKPPVAFPCALIDIDMPGTEDLHETEQLCTVRITIRLAELPKGPTHTSSPQQYQAQALAFWDLADEAFSALQGFETAELTAFTRISQTTERRDDNLKVIAQVWETTFVQSV